MTAGGHWVAGRCLVVTGGAGFLGSHLCDRLIDLGAVVVCIDNFLTGSAGNVAHLLGHPRFRLIDYDVCGFLHVPGRVDAVLHFASPASPKDYLDLPIQTLTVGAQGTHNALGLARHKRARFVLASTSEVYGDPQVSPQAEEYWGNVNPISPRGVYDEAKRFAEAMTMAYHRYYGLDTRMLRIFNTFGPRMRLQDGRVVSNFIVQALTGRALTVYGTGRQTRSLCFVSDMIDGIIAALEAESDRSPEERTDRRFLYDLSQMTRSSIHNPINLGNPHEVAIIDLARQVLRLAGRSDDALEFRELPVDDPQVRRPDIRRAHDLLGWAPRIPLERGLQATIDDFHGRVARDDEPLVKATGAERR